MKDPTADQVDLLNMITADFRRGFCGSHQTIFLEGGIIYQGWKRVIIGVTRTAAFSDCDNSRGFHGHV